MKIYRRNELKKPLETIAASEVYYYPESKVWILKEANKKEVVFNEKTFQLKQ